MKFGSCLRFLLLLLWLSFLLPGPLSAAAQGTWSTAAALPHARTALGCTTGPDGLIYAIGGQNASDILSAVDAYDPITNTWSARNAMPTARNSVAVVTGKNGLIYAIGGFNFALYSAVEAFNPPENFWQSEAPMLEQRSYPGAVTATDGRIYVFGGATNYYLNSAEVYDPVLNRWSAIPPMNTPRIGPGVAQDGNGKIYVIGGYNSSNGSLQVVEIYDPVAQTWTTGAPMPTARALFGTARGLDGKIYCFGGQGPNDSYLNTVESYDPATDTWKTETPMPTARGYVGCAALPDGRIFVIGGSNKNIIYSTVEVYTPKSAALALSNVTAVAISPTFATVSWTSSTPASSIVEYGLTPSYGYMAQDNGRVTSHKLNLNNLAPRNLYFYRVKSTDANGKTVISPGYTFVTGPDDAAYLTASYSNIRRLSNGDYAVDVTVRNIGANVALNAVLSSATLSVSPVSLDSVRTKTPLPVDMGSILPGSFSMVTLHFPASAGISGSRMYLPVGGGFDDPPKSSFFRVFYAYSAYIKLP